MTVGRNDPCPCGSGKKYKKCCLKKENVIQLAGHQVEQFYRQKQGLVEMLSDFLVENVSFEEYHQLEATFRRRTNNTLTEETDEGFFKFWIFFFHRFSNDLRLIEWFQQMEGEQLPLKFKSMLDEWLRLKPRFLQAVDVTDEAIIFEDLLTKERFPLGNHQENINNLMPWMSTLAMIEPFNGLYYFNGVRATVGPEILGHAVDQLSELKKETDLPIDQIITEYYPELLASLSKDLSNLHQEENQHDVIETTITYEILDKFQVYDYLRSQPDFNIENWTKNKKELVWAGNPRAYLDSEWKQPIKLADVYGGITVAKGKLTFKSMDEKHINQLKQRLAKLEEHLQFLGEEKKNFGTLPARIMNRMVHMDEDMPRYFALYAEQNYLEEIEEPLPSVNNLSIAGLVQKGRIEEAETWLRQSEYNTYRLAMEQEGSVEVTADFNTVRKKLGLPLSPFVTGGASRETVFQPIQLATSTSVLLEDDIPYLEELGFTPVTINELYATDMIRYYRIKTDGKTESTKRKYRNGLSDLRDLIEDKSLEDWHVDDRKLWREILTTDFGELFIGDEASKSAQKEFLSVVRGFFTWLDQAQFKQIIQLIKQLEKEISYVNN